MVAEFCTRGRRKLRIDDGALCNSGIQPAARFVAAFAAWRDDSLAL